MVVGMIGNAVPAEVLVAADVEVVPIVGEPGTPTPLADRFVEPMVGERARSQLQRVLARTYGRWTFSSSRASTTQCSGSPRRCARSGESSPRSPCLPPLLRTTWIASAGHGNQTVLERLAGFVKLIERLDAGTWSSTTAEAMTEASAQVDAASELAPGVSRFIDYKPLKPLREWDGKDFGTYDPGS